MLRSRRGSRPGLILRSGPKDRVSKDEAAALMLRDAALRAAPQHEGKGGPRTTLAPQDEADLEPRRLLRMRLRPLQDEAGLEPRAVHRYENGRKTAPN